MVVPLGGSLSQLSNSWQEANQIQERLKNELTGKGVKSILTSSHTFGTQGWLQLGYSDAQSDRFRQFYAQEIDYEYFDAMEMQIVDGRAFSKEFTTDEKRVIVNETFAQLWELDQPIGVNLPEPWQDYQKYS